MFPPGNRAYSHCTGWDRDWYGEQYYGTIRDNGSWTLSPSWTFCPCTNPGLIPVSRKLRFTVCFSQTCGHVLSNAMPFKVCRWQWFQLRCNILTCTIFYHDTYANVSSCPIPVYPWAAQCVLKDVLRNPRCILRFTGRSGRIRMLHRICQPKIKEYIGMGNCTLVKLDHRKWKHWDYLDLNTIRMFKSTGNLELLLKGAPQSLQNFRFLHVENMACFLFKIMLFTQILKELN